MIGAFAYLIGRSAWNRLARQLRRLRQPRYALALALGLAYLWLLLVRQRPESAGAALPDARWVGSAVAMGVALLVAWSWIFGAERRALAFTPAEVTFLFPAPLTRRQLIHFKLLRGQLVILLNTLLWTLLLTRDRLAPSTWLRATALWALLTTLSLHRLGASFVRGSLAAHGRSGAVRRIGSLTIVALALLLVGWAALDTRDLLAAGWADGIEAFFRSVAAALERPVARALLAPFLLAVRPLLAADPSEWARAMPPALALLAVHYVWVVRSDAAFEEAAAEAALRRPTAERPRRIRRRSPPYRLAATGAPAEAIFWKNLVGVSRTGRPRTVLLALAAASFLAAVLSFSGSRTVAEIIGLLAAMWAGFLLVVGPQWIRSDLRSDLPKVHLLRSYPVSGRGVVAAEVAASTLVLTLLQLGVLALSYLAFAGNAEMDPDLAGRTAALAVAAVILPAVNYLGLLIHNGAAILYPAWMGPAPGRPGGVEALGQNMLAIIAYLLLLAVALILPTVSGVAVFVLLREAAGWWAVIPAASVGLLAAAGEARVMVGWLGRAFERMD